MTSKERAYLRSQAQLLEPVVQIGREGLNPDCTRNTDEALTARELVKVNVQRNCLTPVKEVAEMRAALEVLALRHAAQHLTPAILDAAEEATKAGDNSRDVRSWEEANRRFHRLILEPCAMPRLISAIDDLHAASARFLFAAWRSDWEARTDHDHRAILSALRKGQIEAACTTLAGHVQWIGHRPQKSASGGIRDAFAIVG